MSIVLVRPENASVRLIECSPPSWMVAMVLEEKGCPYEEREVSFARGEHRSPEMLELNPRGTVPVLIDGAIVLRESLAMLEYIELAHPRPPLLPDDLGGRARAVDRLHESGNLKGAGMALFAHLMRGAAPQRTAVLRDAFGSELAHWERDYDASPYACGDAPTLADYAIFVYVATAAHLGYRLPPALRRFHERMRTRPSVERTWPKTWSSDHDVLA
jgi:glutathione S-transferase